MNTSRENLLASIQEKMCNFPVTLSDLERPTSEFMMNYFVRFLSELGVDTQAMNQRREDPHYDCYKDTALYVQVYHAIKQVYPVAKFLRNFSVFSLMDPKPSDVDFVAVMNNFHDFVSQRMSAFLQPALARVDAHRERVEELKSLRDMKQSRITEAAAQRSKRDIALAKADERCIELIEMMKTNREKIQVLQLQCQHQEVELQALRQEYDSFAQKLSQLLAESERLQRREELLRLSKAYQHELAVLEAEQCEKSELMRRKAAMRRGLEKALATEEIAAAAVTEAVRLAALSESTSTHLPLDERQLFEIVEKKKQLSLQVEKIELRVKELQAANDVAECDIKAASSASDKRKQKLTQQLETSKQITEELSLINAKIKEESEAISVFKDAQVKLEEDFKGQYRELEERVKHVFASFTEHMDKKAGLTCK